MSDMTATLSVVNQTPFTLTRSSFDDPKDGTYETQPPSTISAGCTGSFIVHKTHDYYTVAPEGFVNYSFNNGIQDTTVTISWNVPDNNRDDSAYTGWSDNGDASVSVSADRSDQDDQSASYTVTYHWTTTLQDYDMVMAMSMYTINTQLSTLCSEGLIAKKLDVVVNDGSGWSELSVTGMWAPSVAAIQGDDGALTLKLNHVNGTLKYVESGQPCSTSLSAVTIAFTVPVALQTVSDASGLITTTAGSQQASALLAQGFSVLELFLDLTNPSNISQMTVTGVTLSDAARSTLAAALRQYTAGQNRWPVGLLGSAAGSHPTTPVPGLIPTAARFSTTWNSADAGLSTLNYLVTMQNRGLPAAPDAGDFATPWIPSSDVYGTYALTYERFQSSYVEGVILSQIASALGLSNGLVFQGVSWMGSTSSDNSDLNGGRGQKIPIDDMPDAYYLETKSLACTVQWTSFNPPTLSGTCTASVAYEVRDWPLVWVGPPTKLGDVTYTQPFTFVITLNGSGDVPISPSFSYNLDPNQFSYVEDTGGLVNVIDEIAAWVCGVFGWEYTSVNACIESATQSAVQQALQQLGGNFASKAATLLGGDTNLMVFPTGATATYGAATITTDSNNTPQTLRVNFTFQTPS